MSSDELRASDADRQAIVDQLNKAYGEGRLDTGEFEDRVADAMRAKTIGELAPLTADLPQTTLPAPKATTAMDIGTSDGISPLRAAIGTFAVPPIICTVIYLLTTPGGYFWPAWVWFGCGIPVLIAAVATWVDDDD
ncbi:MAG: DUF1707 domain-containing protein [Actinomycetota bacterium]